MYEDIINKTQAQFQDAFAPAKKFSSLLIDQIAKVTDFQVNALRSYADLSIEQLRAASKVSDQKSLQDYVSNQSKVAKTVGEKLTADANTLADFGKEFGAEVQKLAQENAVVFGKFGKAA